jgi:hypothetical protein
MWVLLRNGLGVLAIQTAPTGAFDAAWPLLSVAKRVNRKPGRQKDFIVREPNRARASNRKISASRGTAGSAAGRGGAGGAAGTTADSGGAGGAALGGGDAFTLTSSAVMAGGMLPAKHRCRERRRAYRSIARAQLDQSTGRHDELCGPAAGFTVYALDVAMVPMPSTTGDYLSSGSPWRTRRQCSACRLRPRADR